MRTLVQSLARRARRGGVVRLVSTAAIASAGCATSAPPRAASYDFEAAACFGALCMHPDHVLATRVGAGAGERARCLVVAWDGAGALPPTARVGVDDDAPAHPGVFAVVDLPDLAPFSRYAIARDPSAVRASAAVYAARVDPAVRFADQRFADEGSVRVEPRGEDELVIVSTRWEGRAQTASFTVPRAANGCASKGRSR